MSIVDAPVRITDDYRRTALARAVPYSYFADGAWWLPPDPDPDSARIALRLFPALSSDPELVARARLSAVDYTPIDLASGQWAGLGAAGQQQWLDATARTRAAALEYINRKGEHQPLTPHPFQDIDSSYAAYRLEGGYGAYFGWEMGLGKTLGAALVMDGWNVNFALIACPKNARQDPWVNDAAQLCPWMKFIVIGDSPRERARTLDEVHERLEAGEPTALVAHYRALVTVEQSGPKTVPGWRRFGQWDLFVSDEAHTYKNRTAQFTSAARRIKAAGRLNLSGSVMSGRAEDMFVPWQMFQPKRYKSQWRDWNDRFLEVIVDDYQQKQIVGPKLHRLQDFRAELGEVLTVRLAKDWLDIPEPHVVDRTVSMLPEQRKVYRALAEELIAELPDGEFVYAVDGAPLRTALRQVTVGVPAGPGAECEACDGGAGGVDCICVRGNGLISAKIDAAMEDIEAAGDSQCVYFAWHKRAVHELERRCKEAGVGVGVVSGDVSMGARERTIDLFKRGGYRVLVATIATLSSAVNLQNASVVGMLEESDDPVDNEQAVGRVVRQGQPAHASVFYYRCENTVDDLGVHVNATTKAELRRLILGTK
jgi:hypothetical protein